MKETVTSLAEQVAAGTLAAVVAGPRMRMLLSTRPIATTIEEKRERYNEAAIETDPNSFIHVSALYSLGHLSEADYAILHAAVIS